MSVAAQSLMENVTYEDLYKRWEQGNWSAYDIDFSGDRKGWDGLTDIQRRSAMWIYSMFFYGEDRVADTLAPYITAAPTEEQSYFLATQQVDEVRHSVFFHRFFKEVIGVGGDSLQQTLASTLPQLNWGYHGIFDRLDTMAEELRKDRSLPKYAQAITLYHLIVEGSLAQPGQHFIEDFFASEETMPGFSSGMENVSKDEQRHIGFGVKVLSELLGEGSPGWEENRAAVVELLRETLPYGVAVFTPPNWDRAYTECYGFSIEDIFAFGLKLIRQRWRTIGFPTEEMPPGVFPFDPEMPEDEIAKNQIKLLEAGVVGQPGLVEPQSSPELQRLFFDIVSRSADSSVANGSPARLPVALQRRRPLAHGRRQRLDPGRARRSPERQRHLRDELGRLGALDPARRQPREVDDARQDPAPRQDPRAAADAQGLPGLAERRRAVRPGPLGLDLGGEREQRRLVAVAGDDLDRERHPVGGEAERAPPSPGCRGGSRGRRRDRSGPSRCAVAQRAPALPAPHRERGVAHHRHDQDVEVVEDRVHPRGVRVATGAAGVLVEGVGQQAAQPAEAAGAAFEALRMGDFVDRLGHAGEEAGGDVVADPAPVGVALGDVVAERAAAARPASATAPLTSSETVGGARRARRARSTTRRGACRAASAPTRRRAARAAAAPRAPSSRRRRRRARARCRGRCG